jgi:hypothetical protein
LHPHRIASFRAAALVRIASIGLDAKNSLSSFPAKVLRSRLRKLFLIYLRKAFLEGKLRFHGAMAGLAQPAAFEALRPAGGADQMGWLCETAFWWTGAGFEVSGALHASGGHL